MNNPKRCSLEKYEANLRAHITLSLGIDRQTFAPFDLARDAEQDQYSVWYSECLEYNTWINQYHEALNPEEPAYKVTWVTGIPLKLQRWPM